MTSPLLLRSLFTATDVPLVEDLPDLRGRACAISLTRQVAGEPSLTTRLTSELDGWHATWPDRTYHCNQPDGQTATWQLHSTWVLRFSDHGTSVEAHERNFSSSPACGWATDTIDWTAGLSRMP